MEKKKKAKVDANQYNVSVMYRDFEDVGYYIGNTGKIYISPVKKIKNVYPLVYSTENLIKSQYTAQKGKKNRGEVKAFNDNLNDCLATLYEILSE